MILLFFPWKALCLLVCHVMSEGDNLLLNKNQNFKSTDLTKNIVSIENGYIRLEI